MPNQHYYSNQPEIAHDRKELKTELRGQTFNFLSDAGVFSKSGVDYGSKVLIEAMNFNQHAEVLDVGRGYGPIGLSAARMAPQGHVTMIDINSRAVELAKENAKRNGISNVTILESDLFLCGAGSAIRRGSYQSADSCRERDGACHIRRSVEASARGWATVGCDSEEARRSFSQSEAGESISSC